MAQEANPQPALHSCAKWGRNALIQQRDNLNRQSIALTEQFEILNKEANSFAAASQNAKDLNTQRKFEAKYAESEFNEWDFESNTKK